jgi:hypothetical protein
LVFGTLRSLWAGWRPIAGLAPRGGTMFLDPVTEMLPFLTLAL